MPAKQIVFDAEAREKIAQGVAKLARAVVTTLGPKGQTAILDKGWGAPNITKDGVSVAEEIELIDPYENCGAQMVKEVATKTSDVAGDGTTTATLLAHTIYSEGLKRVVAGYDPGALLSGIKKAVACATAELKKLSRKVEGKKDITFVAAVASNNDTEVGKIIAQAQEQVGKEGVITVEDGKGAETEVKVVEGMQFDRGFISPNFVNKQESMTCEFDNPLILIHEDKLSSAQPLVPLLEKVSSGNRPLLIIAESVEGEALATLVVNKLRGILNVCAVKAPGYGDRRKAMLQDLAILTGATPIMADVGGKVEDVTLKQLGTAKKVIVDSEYTTIREGAGSTKDIQARISEIKIEIERTTSDYDREKLQERLAKLAGGIAVIKVGAPTEPEMKELKARVEDALHATRAAMEEGILPGGGVGMLRASVEVSKLKGDTDAEQQGIEIIADALKRPIRQIAENAGKHGALISQKVLESKSKTFGYNAATDEYGDMYEFGIVDPLKVSRTAIEKSASVAGLLLTTDAIITKAPEKEQPEHDHDDHGDFED
ncbi:MAG: 60 kDa chaperonin 2 [Planctomycetota bacterium]|nr:MAG: 60 kDa chaperonin 2 [Planctomycetota bacterium]